MNTKSVALAPKPAGWEAEPPKKIQRNFKPSYEVQGRSMPCGDHPFIKQPNYLIL
jgi:hypothetical protein